MMAVREFLNVVAILESLDDVPDLPDADEPHFWTTNDGKNKQGSRIAWFRHAPVRFLQKADDEARAAIWAEVERRLAGGA